MFGRKIGPHERAAMERRRQQLRLKPALARWEGRELDELERELGVEKPSALADYAEGRGFPGP